jgi:hypothetical protein
MPGRLRPRTLGGNGRVKMPPGMGDG